MKEGFEIGKGVTMLKLGVIGTGAISHHFIEAAHSSGNTSWSQSILEN